MREKRQISRFCGISLALCMGAAILTFGGGAPAIAQEVKADVKVILDRLPDDKQQALMNFGDKISQYIGNYQWVEEDEGGEIRLTVQLYLEYMSTSQEDRYKANILVSNNSDAQFFDKRARFAYAENSVLLHQEHVFDSLTGLIDFFVYMVLGSEFDKYGKFLGEPYFKKALDIAEQGKFSRYSEGWDLRHRLVYRTLSQDERPFREMKDLYFYGMSFWEDDVEKARKYVRGAIRLALKFTDRYPQHVQMRQFLDAHYIELIDLFKDGPSDAVFTDLMKIDISHIDAYKKHLNQTRK